VSSENTNPFVAVHTILDDMILSVVSKNHITDRTKNLDESLISTVEETDILLSIKKKFLLGHFFAEQQQFQQAMSLFKESSLLQEELSFEELTIPTYTALFFCSQQTNSNAECFEYASLSENTDSLPNALRITVLEAKSSLYTFAGYSKESIATIDQILSLVTDNNLVFSLRILQSYEQLKLGLYTLIKESNLHQLQTLHQQIVFSKEVSIQYLELLLQLKEYNAVAEISNSLKEMLEAKGNHFSEFLYYSLVASSSIAKDSISDDQRKKVVSICLQEQNSLYAIKSILLFLTNDQLRSDDALSLLETAVGVFNESIPIELQIEVFEKLVEVCEVKQEWNKGLRYFEMYHNCLQELANKKNQRNFEQIQLKQTIESFHQQSKKYPSQSISTSIIQRHHQLRQEQIVEFDRFVKAISAVAVKNIQTPLDHLLTIPSSNYSKILGECIIDVSKSMIINIETIIELHTLEDGTYNGISETMSLQKIIALLSSQFQNFANLYECTLEIYVEDSIQWYGDIHLLSKVLYHITHNACKFSLKHSTIVLSVSLTSTNLVINITDSGVGVATEHLGLVFLKYFQYDPLSLQTHSAGLGLTYCKNAIEYVHGTIQLTSKKDIGTQVTISLPFSSSVEIASPNTPTTVIAPLSTDLTTADKELLQKNSIDTTAQTLTIAELIERLDTLQGSNQFDNWKRQLYISILTSHKDTANKLFEQIS
jgi:tetratricopeptide (TPR) repeat protein